MTVHNLPERTAAPDAQGHLGICVPSGDDVRADFAFALAGLVQRVSIDPPPGIAQVSMHNHRGSQVHQQRYGLTLEALSAGCTHLLWIDSDMLFPTTAAHQLLVHGTQIVAINARMRRPPFGTCAVKADGHTPMQTSSADWGLEIAHRVGFGMVLIEREVFEKLPPPWFETPFVPDANRFRGEDYSFCELARQGGYSLYVDHDLSKQIAHVGSWGLTVGQDPVT